MEATSKPPTAYQDGTLTLDEVLQVGEDLRRRIAEETKTERKEYLEIAGELRVMPVFRELAEQVDQALVEELIEQVEHREDARVAWWSAEGREALKRLQQAYVNISEYVLDQAHETGEFEIEFAPGSRHDARAAVGNAAMQFPICWLRLSNEAGPLRITVGERGEYVSISAHGYPEGLPCQPLSSARIRLQEDDLYGSAIHELAHRFQDIVPGLAYLEQEYYEQRVVLADDTLAPAEPLVGYESSELVRHGQFFTPYAGLDPRLGNEPDCCFELFPCGVAALLGGDLEEFERFVRYADDEHEAFVLGCLATL